MDSDDAKLKMVDSKAPESSSGLLSDVITEIVTRPVNLVLLLTITFLVYKIFKSRSRGSSVAPPEQALPKLRKDLTIEELKEYKGKQHDGRILLAVNGKIFDVTKGKRYYGEGGPYAALAGRDASRSLATFCLSSCNDGYDDLSDLDIMEMESVKEWEMQFKEKYEYVGRLLKPGEEPTNYSEEEEESNVETQGKGKGKGKPKSE